MIHFRVNFYEMICWESAKRCCSCMEWNAKVLNLEALSDVLSSRKENGAKEVTFLCDGNCIIVIISLI